MYSIGQFSKITGLTVKTLRFYHEQKVLEPTCIDDQSGYRFYAESKVETARLIGKLKQLDFSLHDIAEILSNYDDESDILEFLEERREAVAEKLKEYREIDQQLNQIIASEQEARRVMAEATFEVQEKTVEAMLIAGVRMTGRYSDCGKGFGKIGRRFGRVICGKPFLLHYDTEYHETDADFEACMPIKRGESQDGISVRSIDGGRCVSLLHKGPYEELGRSYEAVFHYGKENKLKFDRPSREVYIKGPGLILKGNPKKYLTEIQLMIAESGDD